MKSFELRKAFLDFFEKKKHQIIASSSLLPADPTSLFTSAGMQQFIPYLSGEVEPPYTRACSVQKCLRVNDIDEVGDEYHHTFFEMLGNWSFGDYFKEGAIDFALEFLLDVLKLKKEKIWISVFKGEQDIPKDKESIKLWQERGISRDKIYECSMKDNFWGPVSEAGPCGPCSEIFYDRGEELGCGKPGCGPNCPHCLRFVEIWNLVFMEYNKTADGNYEKLPRQNVDTGMGDRTLSILQNTESDYETDVFWPIIQEIEKLSGKKYEEHKKNFRVIADHLRASSFVIAEGVLPSNLDRGYVLRMLLRRTIRHAKILDLPRNWYVAPIKKVAAIYGDEYPEVRTKEADIITVFQKEEEKFERCLQEGTKQVMSLLERGKKKISGQEAFDLYQSYGFPLELTKEMAREKGFEVDGEGFKKQLEKHREISRAGVERKFGGVGIEQLEDEEEKRKATRLHTATHLLHMALREVLGEDVQQMGSDITPKRLRFDFSYSQKMSAEEIKKVEKLVNHKIKQDLVVSCEEMSYEDALAKGALAFFKEQYPKKVFVYSIGDEKDEPCSREICRGPHVGRTSELGQFEIIKEESAGAGIRRIKAIFVNSK